MTDLFTLLKRMPIEQLRQEFAAQNVRARDMEEWVKERGWTIKELEEVMDAENFDE